MNTVEQMKDRINQNYSWFGTVRDIKVNIIRVGYNGMDCVRVVVATYVSDINFVHGIGEVRLDGHKSSVFQSDIDEATKLSLHDLEEQLYDIPDHLYEVCFEVEDDRAKGLWRVAT